jgi:hypothetical protein
MTITFAEGAQLNKIQTELWGDGPYPPRTIIEVDRLNQDDIVEAEGTFYSKHVELTNAHSMEGAAETRSVTKARKRPEKC